MVTDITETEMSLTWKANANHGASPIVSYTVEYFSHETGEVSTIGNDFFEKYLFSERLYIKRSKRLLLSVHVFYLKEKYFPIRYLDLISRICRF